MSVENCGSANMTTVLLGEPVGTDDELDERFATGYLPAYERAWRSFDDVAPALSALRAAGYRLAVLTNGSEHQQTSKLRAIGLLDIVGPVSGLLPLLVR